MYDNPCFADCAGVAYTDGYCPEERNGTVLNLGYPAVDGCGWVIQFDFDGDAYNYRPDSLPAEKQVDALNVRVNYTLTLENSPCGFAAPIPIIEINSIENR